MRGNTAAWLDGSAPKAPFRRKRLAGCCIIGCAGRDSIASSSWESASRIEDGTRSCIHGTPDQGHRSDRPLHMPNHPIARSMHQGDQGVHKSRHAATLFAGLRPPLGALALGVVDA